MNRERLAQIISGATDQSGKIDRNRVFHDVKVTPDAPEALLLEIFFSSEERVWALEKLQIAHRAEFERTLDKELRQLVQALGEHRKTVAGAKHQIDLTATDTYAQVAACAADQKSIAGKLAALATRLGEKTEEVKAVVTKTGEELQNLQKAGLGRMEEERSKWARQVTSAVEEMKALQRKLMVWGPAAILASVVVTVGLTVGVTWWLTDRATSIALSSFQQSQTQALGEIRRQVVSANVELEGLNLRIRNSERLAMVNEAFLRMSLVRVMDNSGQPTGEFAVEVPAGERPWTSRDGHTFITAKLK